MSSVALADQIALLRATLKAVEHQVDGAALTPEGLAEFKSAVDDIRLRVWGLLLAPRGDDYQVFQDRFRIRRAREICRDLRADIAGGKLGADHPELSMLRSEAEQLVRSIDAARAESPRNPSSPIEP